MYSRDQKMFFLSQMNMFSLAITYNVYSLTPHTLESLKGQRLIRQAQKNSCLSTFFPFASIESQMQKGSNCFSMNTFTNGPFPMPPVIFYCSDFLIATDNCEKLCKLVTNRDGQCQVPMAILAWILKLCFQSYRGILASGVVYQALWLHI